MRKYKLCEIYMKNDKATYFVGGIDLAITNRISGSFFELKPENTAFTKLAFNAIFCIVHFQYAFNY